MSLLWILYLCGALGPALPLPLHLVAVFPPDSLAEGKGPLARALRKAASDADSGMLDRDLTLLVTAFQAVGPLPQLLSTLCGALGKQRPPPSVVLSFVERPLSFYVSLLGSHVNLPVIGVSKGYQDIPAESVNPHYMSLNPSAIDLGHATGAFLLHHDWSDAILLHDSSSFYTAFAKVIHQHYVQRNHFRIDIQDDLSQTQLFEMVADVFHSDVRVVVVACGKQLTERIFQQAKRANLLNGDWIWILIESAFSRGHDSAVLPPGVLGLKLRSATLDKAIVRSAVLFFASSITQSSRLAQNPWTAETNFLNHSEPISCWFRTGEGRAAFARFIYKLLVEHQQLNGSSYLTPVFDVYNLVPPKHKSIFTMKHANSSRRWKRIGNITGGRVSLNNVLWLGGTKTGPPLLAQERYRVVTAIAPPFVMPSTRMRNESCLDGLPCLQVGTSSKAELIRLFADYHSVRALEGIEYNISCCKGISIDLMRLLSRDMNFAFDLYLVADGYFGNKDGTKWKGMTLDVLSGAAHMACSAYSMTSDRSKVIDFSVPFYYSGISCLTVTKEVDVPLSAFLVPFSAQLWIAIFACLNLTAIFAAIYEWLSPFGLNPWGRMRTRNFSMASALWVMWSLLFSHLVAFKAPKSWPNKVLINLWGCFSVIFVSSYTANIAAHFAGLFFHLRVDDFHDVSLMHQRTGTIKGSASEYYIYSQNKKLWSHVHKARYSDLEEGLEKLRSGKLDVLVGDTVVLDYFRGNDPACTLHLLGQSIFDDAYAIGMQKGFKLKKSLSILLLRYNEYGYIEQLQKKWFGRVPCFNHSVHRLNKPQPLSLRAVAGVFLMLLLGGAVGVLILFIEHAVFKHALPELRKKPKECFWRSLNVMFFSQKLYRFINTVELVSPHHSAKEIVTNLREGQIFSLFQKSVKRKAKEEARRRKSKSQFFEIIQEIRKVVRIQKEQHHNPDSIAVIEPRTLEASIGSPDTIASPVLPLDTERLLLVPQNTYTPPKTRSAWSDLYKRPFLQPEYSQFEGPGLKRLNSPLLYRPLARTESSVEDYPGICCVEDHQQLREEEEEAFDSTVLSISVEDLRLTDSKLHPLKRHRSLDELRKYREDSPNMSRLPSSSEPKIAAAKKVLGMDELLLYSMSKEEIIRSWHASERRLLNRLRDAINEKRSLEKKLFFIQKTLVKPP